MKKTLKLMAVAIMALALGVACDRNKNNNNNDTANLDTIPEEIVEDTIDVDTVAVVEEPEQQPAKKNNGKKNNNKKEEVAAPTHSQVDASTLNTSSKNKRENIKSATLSNETNQREADVDASQMGSTRRRR